MFLSPKAKAQFVSVGVTVADNASVTLNYVTSAPTTTIVQWGTSIALGSSSTGEVIPSTAHKVTITGLAAGTKYSWRVIATDKFGETVVSNYQTFSTTVATHAVNLSWVPADPVYSTVVLKAITSGGPYSILSVVPPAQTIATDSAVTPGTTYFYVVESKDSAGNISAPSNEVTLPVPTP